MIKLLQESLTGQWAEGAEQRFEQDGLQATFGSVTNDTVLIGQHT
ncbi:hypothetical protein PN498_07285 [Oscillatoria sp. CS-180]|nr:hypothetical protein [Oscillatoria sp. CS-180]MDB9525784.1 hypothetical protein [Oscillatoria sp. CS-180]